MGLMFPVMVQAAGIQGVVKDALGRPVAGAGLSLQTVQGKAIARVTSGEDGQFMFPDIASGTYAVITEKQGFRMGTAIVTVSQGKAAQASITLAAEKALELSVVAEKLEEARNGLSPKTGGSVYHFAASDIDKLPQGESTTFNQVLLQAPGVVSDSAINGIHVRGDHANIQYRINGVILPEGISGFGQSMDTRYAQSIDLMTGALPAQYGLRTAGVIEITTKSKYEAGGHVDIYGGSNQTFNPSFEYGNSDGKLSWFLNGSYLTNNAGIESPTPGPNPLHDTTKQYKGFGYLSYLPNPETKLSFMFGSFDGKFQIPNNTALGTSTLLGLTRDSATLNDQQREVNRFAVAALQSSAGDSFDYQVALFTRYSSAHYMPDITGNLVFNNAATDILRSSTSAGIQADGSYRLSGDHTLRMGLFGNSEDIVSNNTSTVFALDALGNPAGAPFAIVDNNPRKGNTLMGLYLQDEWKATNKLTVNYGVRFDQVNAFVNEHQLSPRIGVVYKVDGGTTWHAGYARYFTPPPTELVSSKTLALFNGTTLAVTGLNSPVRSERSHYLDAGVLQQFSPALSFGVDTFYKQIKNLIDEGQFGPALILSPYNYEQGKIYGIELTGNYKSGNFSSYANLSRTYSWGKNVISNQFLIDPATVAFSANHWTNVDHQQAVSFSTGGSYLWDGTRLSADLTYQSGLRSGLANISSLPSYTVVNFGASRKMELGGLGEVEGRVSIVNALDKIYQIRNGTGIGVFAPQYGARRGLFVGLDKKF